MLTIPLARLVELGEEAFAEEEGSGVFLRDLDSREKRNFHVSVLISGSNGDVALKNCDLEKGRTTHSVLTKAKADQKS